MEESRLDSVGTALPPFEMQTLVIQLVSRHLYWLNHPIGLDPEHPCKRLGAVVHVCNPALGRVEAGRSLELHQLSQSVSFRFIERTCLKNEIKTSEMTHWVKVPGAPKPGDWSLIPGSLKHMW